MQKLTTALALPASWLNIVSAASPVRVVLAVTGELTHMWLSTLTSPLFQLWLAQSLVDPVPHPVPLPQVVLPLWLGQFVAHGLIVVPPGQPELQVSVE